MHDFKPSPVAASKYHRMPLGCAPFALLLSICAACIGLWMLKEPVTLVLHGVSTTGRVLSYTVSSDDCDYRHSGDEYEVFFVTSKGDSILLDENAPSCSEAYNVGDTVSVIYDPGNPHMAQVATFRDLWFLPAGLTVGGVFGCLLYGSWTIAFFIRFRQRRSSKKQTRLHLAKK